MPERKGQYTVLMSSRPTILGYAAVVGKKREKALWDGISIISLKTPLWERKPGKRRKALCSGRRSPGRWTKRGCPPLKSITSSPGIC